MTSQVVKLIDTTQCIGCKACEVACQEWNDQEFTLGTFDGSYQTFPELQENFWNLIKFNEYEKADGGMSWLMTKYQCMHCLDAGCLKACPAPGAIVQRPNGIVDFVQESCIGCGYCITGCPFDVPKLSAKTKKVYKCTLCSDRVAVGLEPACIKTCPTNCLSFGTRENMLMEADSRASALKANGHDKAGVYNPAGVGGTNVMYVLKDASEPEMYGLPKDPTIPLSLSFWKGPVKWLGSAILAGGILGSFFHYVKFGPKHSGDEDEHA